MSFLQSLFPTRHARVLPLPRDVLCGRRNIVYAWLIFVCMVVSCYMLSTFQMPTGTLLLEVTEETTEQNLRPPRKRFELFSLRDDDDEEQEEEETLANTAIVQPIERKRFELFSLWAPDEDQESSQLSTYELPSCKGKEIDRKSANGDPVTFEPSIVPRSVLVRGGVAEVHIGPRKSYQGVITESEGCVDIYDSIRDYAPVQFTLYSAKDSSTVLSSWRQIPDSLQAQFSTATDRSQPQTRIVFSATSSEYFGYQIYANALGFLQSNQTNASWMRLLTAKQPDDLSEHFPTFTAPKSLYTREYIPINKADIIDKWFHSEDAPHPDDTIVVIDPDNWLLKDVQKWTQDVSPKNAVGQVAYYGWDTRITKLWKAICEKNCDQKLDPVGVPYFVKASDLKEIAPLWRSYSIAIHQKMMNDAAFKKEYETLGIDWAAEMVGYNAACAHLQIKTKVVDNLQVRDTSTTRDWNHWSSMPMIHMGRAWFPSTEKELAAPWTHEDDGGFSSQGIQVWCKCNNTASKVQPWPMPNDMDFVSYHTLRLMHESVAHFGPVPVNETFRREDSPYMTPI